jgi:hypothetical protein
MASYQKPPSAKLQTPLSQAQVENFKVDLKQFHQIIRFKVSLPSAAAAIVGVLMLMLSVFILAKILQFGSSKSSSNSSQETMTGLVSAVVTSGTAGKSTHQATITFGTIRANWWRIRVGGIWVLVVGALLWELLRWRWRGVLSA